MTGKIVLCMAAALCLFSAGRAEMRVWEDKEGNRFEAEYVRELFGTVILKTPERRSLAIDVKDFSKQDIEYLRTMIPPEIEIGFSKRTKDKEMSIFARADDSITIVTGVVEIKKESKGRFDGKLKAEVYMVAQEIATPDFYLLGKKTLQVSFPPEEGRSVYECELTVETRRYIEYNQQLRGREFAGYVVVVLGPQGNRIITSTDLSWLRDEDVELLRQLPPKTFFDENCWEMPVPRPEFYTARYLY